MEPKSDLTEILDFIDPVELNYQEWVNVGMALKHEGYSISLWDDWSKRDGKRYHSGECRRKWDTFKGSGSPVTAGTLIQMAQERGWQPIRNGGRELDWNDVIGEKDDLVVVNRDWIEEKEIKIPKKWNPAKELITYLETLFEANENVGYVTKSWEKDGKYMPSKGCYDRTAGQLIHELSSCGGDIGSVLGDYNLQAGAWIRFNPLDGKGVKNDNVTDFRYALIESDTMEIEKQNAIIREMELPVACLVHSGKKSLHAIVRIDAANYEEYRKRVDYLYNVCQKNGMELDRQNRNPSRLSRMPGVMRGDNRQFLVDVNIGKESWDQWYEWIESVNDDLPEPESMADAWENLPELSPPLIKDVLRQGHKMLLAGPSKAGKSYSLIELCCAVAEGRKWLGFDCAQGKILYVNLELDRASCLHRFKDVYKALGWNPENLRNIDIWNLRGKSIPMDKLAPKLIRRANKKNYIAVIIDPIYKVITGDENSADQMAKFCNQFDKVCTELGCAVIYCHHHSKGLQGGKKSMDRASGSGVFARDPDALLDLIELDITDDLRRNEENKAVCKICLKWLQRFGKEREISQDDRYSPNALSEACRQLLPPQSYKLMMQEVNEEKVLVDSLTAWRVEGTLREFPKFSPVNLWFKYPVHMVDETGCLNDVEPDSEKPPWQKAMEKRKPKEKKLEIRKAALETAFEACKIGGEVTLKDLAEYMGVTEKTIRNHVKEHQSFVINESRIEKKT